MSQDHLDNGDGKWDGNHVRAHEEIRLPVLDSWLDTKIIIFFLRILV